MYTSIYIYIYTCIYIYTHTYIHIHTHTYIYVYIYIDIHTHTYIFIYTFPYFGAAEELKGTSTCPRKTADLNDVAVSKTCTNRNPSACTPRGPLPPRARAPAPAALPPLSLPGTPFDKRGWMCVCVCVCVCVCMCVLFSSCGSEVCARIGRSGSGARLECVSNGRMCSKMRCASKVGSGP